MHLFEEGSPFETQHTAREHVELAQQPMSPAPQEDHSHDIYTVANIVTVLRLILVPLFFSVLLTERSNTLAFALFVLAASTDWLDGQIARRTGTVTAIGKAIDSILAIPGVDAALMGPADLSMSLGVMDPSHPKVAEGIQRTLDGATRRGLACGTHTLSLQDLKAWRDKGMRLLMYHYDFGLIMSGAEAAIKELRA